ncbi:unnamed protein product [Effrenium voratum]|nr:unnamed protein product [Effrenium voratum]
METSGRLSDIDKIISEIEALRSSTRLRLSGQSEAPKADHGQFSPTFARNVVNVGDLSEDPFSEDSIIFSCPPAAAREEVAVEQPSDPTFIAPFPSLETQEAANSKRRGSWPGVAPYDDEDTIGRRDGLDTSALLEVTGSSTEEARPRPAETQQRQERMSIPGAVDDLDTSVPIARSHQEEVEGSRPGPATIVPNLDETQEVETHDQQAPEAGEPAVADSLAAPNEETAASTADAESSLAAEGQVAAAATPAAAMQEKEVQETPAVMTEEAAGCADEDAAVHTEATPEVADVQEMSAMVEDAVVAKASEEHPADISVAKPEDMAAVTFANVPAMQEEQASRQEPPDMVDEPVDSADAKPEDIAAVTDDVPAAEEAAKAVGEEEDAAAHQDMPALDNSVRLSAQAAPDTATEVPAVEEEAARQEFAEMVDEPVDSADAKPEHIAAVADDVPAVEEAAQAVGEEEDAAAHQDVPALESTVHLSAQAAPDTVTEVPAVEEEEPLDMIEKPLDFAAAKPEDTAALVDVPAAQEEDMVDQAAGAAKELLVLEETVNITPEAAQETAMADEPEDAVAVTVTDIPSQEEPGDAAGADAEPAVADAPANAGEAVPAQEERVKDLHQRVEGLEKLVTDLQASLAAKERALQEWEQVQVPDPEEDLPSSPSAMRRELVTLRQQNVTQSALLGILRSKFETSSAKAEEEPGAANRSVKKDQELVDLLGALQMKLSDIKADKGEASALKTADFGKSGTLVEKGADEGVSKPEAELSTPQTRTRRVASVAERALSRSPSPRALPQQALSRSPSPRPLPQQVMPLHFTAPQMQHVVLPQEASPRSIARAPSPRGLPSWSPVLTPRSRARAPSPEALAHSERAFPLRRPGAHLPGVRSPEIRELRSPAPVVTPPVSPVASMPNLFKDVRPHSPPPVSRALVWQPVSVSSQAMPSFRFQSPHRSPPRQAPAPALAPAMYSSPYPRMVTPMRMVPSWTPMVTTPQATPRQTLQHIVMPQPAPSPQMRTPRQVPLAPNRIYAASTPKQSTPCFQAVQRPGSPLPQSTRAVERVVPNLVPVPAPSPPLAPPEEVQPTPTFSAMLAEEPKEAPPGEAPTRAWEKVTKRRAPTN